ncbi:hypothetical protein KAR10_04150 [bacterium]|nr:hypothetical protein [bacterium]
MITYQAGFKYQLKVDYVCYVDIKPKADIVTKYISLTVDGLLTIRNGYAWDGPSGPTVDTRTFMRGSLVHDAIYQLIRQGYLPASARGPGDKELKKICLEDGMMKIRAWWVYRSVQGFASSAALPSRQRQVLYAP